MTDYKLVSVDTLKSIYRDLDACQRVIWLTGDFDPAYCKDAQARLKEIDELLAAPDVQGEPVECSVCHGKGYRVAPLDIMLTCPHCQGSGKCPAPQPAPSAPTFQLGDHVRKTKGSQWKGRVVGTYSTSLTPEGYAVESDTEKGSVQIYPAGALELVGEDAAPDVDVLVEALEEGLRAIGDHHAPDDCYATGPMTGDPFRDLVQCPACSFIAMCDEALAAHRKQQEPSHDNQ